MVSNGRMKKKVSTFHVGVDIRTIKDNTTVQMEIRDFLYYVAAEDFPPSFSNGWKLSFILCCIKSWCQEKDNDS